MAVLEFVVPPVPVPQASRRTASASILAVIPARYDSSRLPGKPLADLDGRPMIEHVYRRVAATASVASVVVATDDDRVRAVVERFGGQARMTSRSHPSGTDRVAEVAATIDCDIVVNVQGDEPLIEPAMIEEAVAPMLADASLPMATLRRAITDPADRDNPSVVKVVVGQNGDALYFSRAAVPFLRDPAAAAEPAPLGWRHVGLYVYRRAFLLAFARLEPTPLERLESLEQLRALEHGFRIRTVPTAYDSLGVDTPEDLDRVRRVLRREPVPGHR